MSDFSNIIAIEKKLKRPKKAPKQAYTVPKWFKALPVGSHGSTPSQKKAWKVVSDYVRELSWENYGRSCADGCGTIIAEWRDGDCGHYKAYSVCHGMFKYELRNLVLQAKNCNRRSDGAVGHGLGEELKRRYGKNHLEWIETENEKHRGEKVEEWMLVEMVSKLCPHLVK